MIGLDLYFKETNNKAYKYIFYPCGPFRTGFLVDGNIKNILEEFNKMYSIILSATLLVLFSIYKNGHIFNIPITTVFFMGIILELIITRLIVIKCKRSNLRISFKERRKVLLKEYSPKKNIYFLIYSTMFLYLSIYFISKFKFDGFSLISTLIAAIYYLISFINNVTLIISAYF